jgi:hypothetical protein
MCCAKAEVWNEEEGSEEAALLAENHRGGGTERDVDSGVLSPATCKGESVLLAATPTESGWAGTDGGARWR